MADRKKNGSSRTTAARILCLVLVLLMLLGTASTVIFYLAYSTPADAAGYVDPVMSIGIQYGDTVTGSFRTYSDTGYDLLIQKPDGDRSSLKLGNIADKTLIVAPHANLAPSGTGFAVSSSGVTLGGYRLDIPGTFVSYAEANAAAQSAANALVSYGYQVFPAYISGAYRVRVGCFASEGDANAAKAKADSALGKSLTVAAPFSNAVSLITSSAKILFEFENGTTNYLGLRPAGSGDVYMRSDNNYIYEGVFMYKRTGNSIMVINIIGLETYIEGVLPYEISSSWHIEAQKAFSIAARSYAMGNRGKHYTSYGFDLCCTTDCQVYRGAGGVTDTVKQAVAATAGKILMYNNRVATLYYSSSTGGCTTSAKDCWGGDGAPYLKGMSTPWEMYTSHSKGFWTVEKTPSELCEYLRGKGYTTLTGAISSVQIVEKAQNSDYVKSVKITDTSGNSVTITNTDKVRINFGLNSANFVVGKGSVAYTVSTVTESTEVLPYNSQNMSQFGVMTSAGQMLSNISGKAKVATGRGVFDAAAYEFVITEDNHKNGGDRVVGGYKTTYENKVATASSPDNFIFVGKGWGHGVGLSQYGCKDLAGFGYSWDKILEAYVPAARLSSVADLG